MRRSVSPLALALVWLAAPALAQERMTAAEFEAYVTGKTLYYGLQGLAYGIEEYLPGRRVRWSFLDGECIEGEWYDNGGEICFAYENRPTPQCWEFFRGPEGISARIASDPEADLIYEIEQSPEPIQCPGPRIGV